MYIIPLKEKNTSSHYNLNMLFNENKTFIMDNHLAACWCWVQKLDINKKYNYFHIDKHYDLLQSQIDYWINELKNRNINLKNITIIDLLKIKYILPDSKSEKCQLFRWDNYFPIFLRLYPQLICSKYFATHKAGNKLDEIDMYEPEIYTLQNNLSYWINKSPTKKWIVNIDIDYFFTETAEGTYIQFMSDEYILNIAKEILKSWEKIEVLTIALSPECCGGWEYSIRVAKILTNYLGIIWNE